MFGHFEGAIGRSGKRRKEEREIGADSDTSMSFAGDTPISYISHRSRASNISCSYYSTSP